MNFLKKKKKSEKIILNDKIHVTTHHSSYRATKLTVEEFETRERKKIHTKSEAEETQENENDVTRWCFKGLWGNVKFVLYGIPQEQQITRLVK